MKGENLKLVISEKPSVAQSIAAVIGAKQRGDGFLEGGGYLVSWCDLNPEN
jgi:DNA topoisomerase-3